MFGMQGYGGGAQYRRLDIAAKVEGASPHGLVAILFDELLLSLEATAAAQRARDYTRRGPRQTRALSILHALEGSLDHTQGGDIADGLAAIYREARRLTVTGCQEDSPDMIDQARGVIAEIAGAWRAIG